MKTVKTVYLRTEDWLNPMLNLVDTSTRCRMIDLICLMQNPVRKGFALDTSGNPLTIESMATTMNCNAAQLRSEIDKLCKLNIFNLDTRTGCLSYPALARDSEIKAKRTIAGRRGGNPSLVKNTERR